METHLGVILPPCGPTVCVESKENNPRQAEDKTGVFLANGATTEVLSGFFLFAALPGRALIVSRLLFLLIVVVCAFVLH